jgi:ankyrin repeat protein
MLLRPALLCALLLTQVFCAGYDYGFRVVAAGPLPKAAYACDVPSLRPLIKKMGVNKRNRIGQTPLLLVAANISQSLARETPLQLCDDISLDPQMEALELLLQEGADPDAKDDGGRTPLQMLLDTGCIQCAQLAMSFPSVRKSVLFRSGSPFLFKTLVRMQSFELAVLPWFMKMEDAAAAQAALRAAGCGRLAFAQPQAPADDAGTCAEGGDAKALGRRALSGWRRGFLAAVLGQGGAGQGGPADMAKAAGSLLRGAGGARGARTLLMHCIALGVEECVWLLLPQAGDSNSNGNSNSNSTGAATAATTAAVRVAVAGSGRTALHLAAAGGYADVARRLVAAGAQPWRRDALGRTARQVGAAEGVRAVLEAAEQAAGVEGGAGAGERAGAGVEAGAEAEVGAGTKAKAGAEVEVGEEAKEGVAAASRESTAAAPDSTGGPPPSAARSATAGSATAGWRRERPADLPPPLRGAEGGRCGIDVVQAADMSAARFAAEYHGQKPVLVRGAAVLALGGGGAASAARAGAARGGGGAGGAAGGEAGAGGGGGGETDGLCQCAGGQCGVSSDGSWLRNLTEVSRRCGRVKFPVSALPYGPVYSRGAGSHFQLLRDFLLDANMLPPPPRRATPKRLEEEPPDARVRCESTAGNFTIELHRAWVSSAVQLATAPLPPTPALDCHTCTQLALAVLTCCHSAPSPLCCRPLLPSAASSPWWQTAFSPTSWCTAPSLASWCSSVSPRTPPRSRSGGKRGSRTTRPPAFGSKGGQ